MSIQTLSISEIQDLNSQSVQFCVPTALKPKAKTQQNKVYEAYLESRDPKHLLTLSKFKQGVSKSQRVLAYLSDNKFHWIDDIVKDCMNQSESIDEDGYSHADKWTSAIQILRKRSHGQFVLDLVYVNGEKYYRLNPPNTISKFDNETRKIETVYVIVEHNLVLSSLEDVKRYCEENNTTYTDMNMCRNLATVEEKLKK